MPGYARPTNILPAQEVPFAPQGNISSTNVQNAIMELDSDFQTSLTQLGNEKLSLTSASVTLFDDLGKYFDGVETRFLLTENGNVKTINNPLRLTLTIDGIIQEVNCAEQTWLSDIPRWGFRIDNEGYVQFAEAPPAGSVFRATLNPGSDIYTAINQNPFKAADILLGV